MITPRTRAILDRYALASRALSRVSGERLASEAGQSVEFYDFRQYQWGDELRYADWKVYARTGRLYTRLFQAERAMALYIILDTSPSMSLGNKAIYAKVLAQLLSYVAQRDSVSQVYLLSSQHNAPAQGRARIAETWNFIDKATPLENIQLVQGLKDVATRSKFSAGAGLALVISDLFDEASLHPALVALKTRGLDASFLQIMAESDLDPEEARLEVTDIETGEKLLVTPEEVRAYKKSLQTFIKRTRKTILQAGFRHVLLRFENETREGLEQRAFAALLKSKILVKR
ncbi:MAG: DUF58 domain-containing protein [Trueperaceae bacterium]